jgi:hypothetical protein
MDLPLQIGVAVYHLAKLRMLDFYYYFIEKCIDRSDFELLEMDTDSNYFAFSADSIEKLVKPEMREEYEKDKYNFLPSCKGIQKDGNNVYYQNFIMYYLINIKMKY